MLITTFEQTKLQDVILLQGLIQLVEYASSRYLVDDDLVTIATVLSKELQVTQKDPSDHLLLLTLFLSRVMDEMVTGKVNDLNRDLRLLANASAAGWFERERRPLPQREVLIVYSLSLLSPFSALLKPLADMTRTSRGGSQADTDDQSRGQKSHPTTRPKGQKSVLSTCLPDEEWVTLPPYQTRSRSRNHLQDSRAAQRPSLSGSQSRYNSPRLAKRNISCRGQRNEVPQEIRPRRANELHDSGFDINDAEEDVSLHQNNITQYLDSPSRLQKKTQSNRRAEWLNAESATKPSQVRSQKRRKVEVLSSPSRVYGYYQPAKESDLSSDSESSDHQGDLSEDEALSSTTCKSSSDVLSNFSFSFSSSDFGDIDDGQSVSASKSSTTRLGPIPSRAVKPRALLIAATAIAAATTTRLSTKPATNQAARLVASTNATTANTTPTLKKGDFGNPSRLLTTKRAVLAPSTTTSSQYQPVAFKVAPLPPTPTTASVRSRSRPPRQVRLKTGRWTKPEDTALYQGVVEYLAQFGLEPKPPAQFPLRESVKKEGEEKEEEESNKHEHEHKDVAKKLQSTSERMVKEGHRQVEYEPAMWRASTAELQMSERHRISNNNAFASESDPVRDRENDIRLFDELVDVSRNNIQADDGSDGSLYLDPRVGQHTFVPAPFHVSSPIESACVSVNMDGGLATESGFVNGHVDLILRDSPHTRLETGVSSINNLQEIAFDPLDQHAPVPDTCNHINNIYLQQHQHQQGPQPQQQYYQHFRDMNHAHPDQHHHIQQHHWPTLHQHYHQYHQHHYQQQHDHQQWQQQQGSLVPPAIFNETQHGFLPHWSEAMSAHSSRAVDVWLAPMNGEGLRDSELRTFTRADLPMSTPILKNVGIDPTASSNNRITTVAAEQAALEMALFEDVFPNTTISTTTTTASPSPSTPTTTLNTLNLTTTSSTSTSSASSSRYKTHASYALAISRRLQNCPWSQIAALTVPGRTGVQAQARWSEALDPQVKKGPWSEEEDALLLEGVERSDKCWIWIADSIEGRTQRQCRTRWVQLTINAERKAALAALEGVIQF
ncbi:hypothetical protein BG015_011807 [Linnemannia schmuckeri]|uniref:Uncharacterized protein n=1 Tax=Linnemannia schmuckeri TaxID=64567 RepID=A0A9P5V7X6_9FUNG|nr:hypothetical protein BG015_011807 [Linnemannia schmuckeri]